MQPNPRDYDTPDDWDDAMQSYICYMETMYDRIDMEIERQKEDERIENEGKTTTPESFMVSLTRN